MNSDKYLINDLVNENRVNFAKLYQLKNLKKEEIGKLFERISTVADSILLTPQEYLKECRVLFNVLFSVVKLTRQEKDLLKDIKSNLEEIGSIRNRGTNKKAN